MTMQMLLARRRMMMQAAVTPSDTYLTFTANTAGSTIEMQAVGSAPSVSLEYSTDGGNTWQTFTVGSTTITLANVGDKVKMKGVNTRLGASGNNYNQFLMTGSIAASGDLTSILNGIGGDVAITLEGTFKNTFRSCASLTSAPSLPSTTLASACYQNTFSECTSLSKAPKELPATTLASTCYYAMFRNCSALQNAPEIFGEELASSCMGEMFRGCSALTSVKIHLLTVNSTNNMWNWMSGVAASGDFYCPQELSIGSGGSGIPNGWTRYNLDGTPY